MTAYTPPLVKTSSELSKPAGTITTSGQEWNGTSFWAPPHVPSVTFSCMGRAAITPLFNVKTYSFGTTYVGGGVGFIGTITNIKVPLAASNTHVTVEFATSDSYGGYCNWICD